MVASEAVHEVQSTKTKSISLGVSQALTTMYAMIQSWGKKVIAKALDIFGLPPYKDGHLCFKDKHCLSNNCHVIARAALRTERRRDAT